VEGREVCEILSHTQKSGGHKTLDKSNNNGSYSSTTISSN